MDARIISCVTTQLPGYTLEHMTCGNNIVFEKSKLDIVLAISVLCITAGVSTYGRVSLCTRKSD